jgi:hypothetical protein
LCQKRLKLSWNVNECQPLILGVLGAEKREVEGVAADFQRLAAHAMPPPPVMTSWGTVVAPPEREPAWRKRSDDGGGAGRGVPQRKLTTKWGAGADAGVMTWRFSGGDADDPGGGGEGGVDSLFGYRVGRLSSGGGYIDRAAAQPRRRDRAAAQRRDRDRATVQRRDRVVAQRRGGAAEHCTWTEQLFWAEAYTSPLFSST